MAINRSNSSFSCELIIIININKLFFIINNGQFCNDELIMINNNIMLVMVLVINNGTFAV